MIIHKYFSLSHKTDYQRSRLTVCFFFSLSMISIGVRFNTAEKIKSLGNSDDIPDQITGPSNDNTLGIPRGNLKLKHNFIFCS